MHLWFVCMINNMVLSVIPSYINKQLEDSPSQFHWRHGEWGQWKPKTRGQAHCRGRFRRLGPPSSELSSSFWRVFVVGPRHLWSHSSSPYQRHSDFTTTGTPCTAAFAFFFVFLPQTGKLATTTATLFLREGFSAELCFGKRKWTRFS